MGTCCYLLPKDRKGGQVPDGDTVMGIAEGGREGTHSPSGRQAGIITEWRGHRLHWLFRQWGLHGKIHHDKTHYLRGKREGKSPPSYSRDGR